jgi:hypothetical protein
VIYALVGEMSAMYTDHVDPDVAFNALAVEGDEDVFSPTNKAWIAAGVVAPSGSEPVDGPPATASRPVEPQPESSGT